MGRWDLDIPRAIGLARGDAVGSQGGADAKRALQDIAVESFASEPLPQPLLVVAANASRLPGHEQLDDAEGVGAAVDQVTDEEDRHGLAELFEQELEQV